MSAAAPLLELRGVSKRFGAALVNDAVDLAVAAGSIHALVGENGAGKTTAMRIASGFYAADGGAVAVDGQARRFTGPQDAARCGIAMVHQHFLLVEPMTVSENVVLGAEPGRGWRLDRAAAAARVAALAGDLGLDVDPAARVADLSVGQRQRVELLRALHRRARVLILDEPTAVLVPAEVARLFGMLRKMRQRGLAVVLITHRVTEVLGLADTVTVLRAGRVVASRPAARLDAAELASLIMGGAAAPSSPGGATAPGVAPGPAVGVRGPRLDVRGLSVRGPRSERRLNGISLAVSPGEVVGVAGVEGNGQRELVEAIAGLTERGAAAGSILLDGVEIAGASVRRRRLLGVAHVPEDRQGRGLALDLSVADNAILGVHDRPPVAVGPWRQWLDRAAVARRLQDIAARFAVQPAAPGLAARALSGGNQQKLVLGREMTPPPRLLLLAQPTRGLDLASTRRVHGELAALRAGGCAILLVSSDLDELLALSDRLLVMYRGKIAGQLDPAAATARQLGLLMSGARVPA